MRRERDRHARRFATLDRLDAPRAHAGVAILTRRPRARPCVDGTSFAESLAFFQPSVCSIATATAAMMIENTGDTGSSDRDLAHDLSTTLAGGSPPGAWMRNVTRDHAP
jgi:hypothetical protein